MSRESSYRIARRLLAANFITHAKFEVWVRNHCGDSLRSMRHDYPNEARRGVPFHETTLAKWIDEVDAAIKKARTIAEPVDDPGGRNPFTIVIAEGHDVREVADKTPRRSDMPPEAQNPLVSSFPDAERLKVYGKNVR